jgi:hypothetical protein
MIYRQPGHCFWRREPKIDRDPATPILVEFESAPTEYAAAFWAEPNL